MAEHSIAAVDDLALKAYIDSAQHRLLLMSPGVHEPVAESLACAWRRLGSDRTTVILDVDPEVCRLGFGTIEAVEMLQRCASECGGMLLHQPGVRIGLMIADASTVVFSPTPLLVEAAESDTRKPNAIVLGALPPEVAGDLGLGGNGDLDRTVGLDPVHPSRVIAVKQDLTESPPAKFDVARIERVFNTRFEFVEFEIKNCLISRKTVPIPSDLMGLARDEKAQRLLRSSFRVIDEESELSGEQLLKIKKEIADDFLVNLPGFGTVILRSNKAAFQERVDALSRYMTCFQRNATSALQGVIDANRESLLKALSPGVSANPPKRWSKLIGSNPSEGDRLAMLNSELDRAFGSAEAVMGRMEVKVLFKGVTYEMLTDPEFIAVAQEKLPMFKDLWEEHKAARESQPTTVEQWA